MVASRRKRNVQKFEDFKGKRFNVGNPGSVRALVEMLMANLGMKNGDFALTSSSTRRARSGAVRQQDRRLRIRRRQPGGQHPGPDDDLRRQAGGRHHRPRPSTSWSRTTVLRPRRSGGMYPANAEAIKTFGVMANVVSSGARPDHREG